jgi:hypothetical protein
MTWMAALRTMPVEMATRLRGLHFTAGQRHRLKNLLMPECRFLIGLFRRRAVLDCIFLVRIPVLFSHHE